VPKLGYDNLEDTKTKLLGTYCYYADKAFTVKTVNTAVPNADNGDYVISGQLMFNGRGVEFKIDDPKFNCTHYNLGYVNFSPSSHWYYRIPAKQYKQGLRYDQVGCKVTKSEYYGGPNFKPSKPLALMLENNYPTLPEALKSVKDKERVVTAFHKNFAVSYDEVHNDFVIEYKGNYIGHTHDFREIKLMREYDHLIESLREVINAA